MFAADLHQHSTASDGFLSPTEVLKADKSQGLETVALTDHDTLAGLSEAAAAARDLGLKFVYGVELSCQLLLGTGSRQKVHILGYWLEMPTGPLPEALAHLVAMRHQRARQIGQRLADLGCPVDIASLLAAHRGGHIGRPHFADALVAGGYVTSRQEAFDRYLKDGGPAYIPYSDPLDAFEAVRLISASKGRAVLAHPGEYGLGTVDEKLPELKAAGLFGIECSHPRNSHETEHHYRQLAVELNLVTTGGSDFHGPLQKGLVFPGKNGCLQSDVDRLLFAPSK